MSFSCQQEQPAAAAKASSSSLDSDDASEARKMVLVEQLRSVYGFDAEVSERALEDLGTTSSVTASSFSSSHPLDIHHAVKYILDNGLATDQGGSVIPKDDCPHVVAHVKIDLDDLPGHPKDALCTYLSSHHSSHTYPHRDHSTTDNNNNSSRKKGQLKRDDDEDEDDDDDDDNNEICSGSENWLCLECGVIRCSRYIKGHGLAHWRDTKEAAAAAATTTTTTAENNTNSNQQEGHCIAASLLDLSVWCHECEAYVRHPLLEPILQRLEQLKFQEAAEEPKKKKARSSCPNSEDETNSRGFSTTQSSADDDDDDDENSDDENSDTSPTIIAMANAVARGIPIDLFHSANDYDDEELEYPFGTLPTSLEDVANFIQSDKCRSVVVLAGAGLSTAAGIPDFRSADGLYATMNPDLITANPVEREAIRMDPTVALEQGMFLQNPLPCLELNREFILGTHEQRWKATLAHRFVELLHAKTGKLVRIYTQNIDGLEDQCTQLPRDKVIAVHGSMDQAECAQCGEEYDFEQFCSQVRQQIKDLSGKDETAPRESTPIACTTCGYNAVKPAIVLFRSSLPMTFFENVPRDISDVDLLIVVGTSLRVAPANSLVWRAPKTAMRLLVNREPVGWHLGMSFGPDATRDYFAQGNCDTVLLDLMGHLGWLNDLEPLLDDEKLPESSAALLRRRLGREDSDGGGDSNNDSDDT